MPSLFVGRSLVVIAPEPARAALDADVVEEDGDTIFVDDFLLWSNNAKVLDCGRPDVVLTTTATWKSFRAATSLRGASTTSSASFSTDFDVLFRGLAAALRKQIPIVDGTTWIRYCRQACWFVAPQPDDRLDFAEQDFAREESTAFFYSSDEATTAASDDFVSALHPPPLPHRSLAAPLAAAAPPSLAYPSAPVAAAVATFILKPSTTTQQVHSDQRVPTAAAAPWGSTLSSNPTTTTTTVSHGTTRTAGAGVATTAVVSTAASTMGAAASGVTDIAKRTQPPLVVPTPVAAADEDDNHELLVVGARCESFDLAAYDGENECTLQSPHWAVLQCCDFSKNNNKFYVLELHTVAPRKTSTVSAGGGGLDDDTGEGGYVLLSHYGRTDDLVQLSHSAAGGVTWSTPSGQNGRQTAAVPGRREARPFATKDSALAAFAALLKQKREVKGYRDVALSSCTVGTRQLQRAIRTQYLADVDGYVAASGNDGMHEEESLDDDDGEGDVEQRAARSSAPTADVLAMVDALFQSASQALSKLMFVKVTSHGVETPLGALSRVQIRRGIAILRRIESTMYGGHKDTTLTTKTTTTMPAATSSSLPGAAPISCLSSLSAEFYSCVPHFLGGRAKSTTQASVINNPGILAAKQDMMQLARDLIRLFDRQRRTTRSAVEVDSTNAANLSLMYYRALRSSVVKLSDVDPAYYWVKKQCSLESMRTSVVVTNVYKVERYAEADRHQRLDAWHRIDATTSAPSSTTTTKTVNATRRLFHGTRHCNAFGILSRGLLLPKAVETTGGKRTNAGWLGQGLYFTDQLDTTTRYTQPGGPDGRTRIAFVCFANVGRSFETGLAMPELFAAPAGYESTHGNPALPGSIFEDSEYCIYDHARQAMTLVVEYRCGVPLPPPHTKPAAAVNGVAAPLMTPASTGLLPTSFGRTTTTSTGGGAGNPLLLFPTLDALPLPPRPPPLPAVAGQQPRPPLQGGSNTSLFPPPHLATTTATATGSTLPLMQWGGPPVGRQEAPVPPPAAGGPPAPSQPPSGWSTHDPWATLLPPASTGVQWPPLQAPPFPCGGVNLPPLPPVLPCGQEEEAIVQRYMLRLQAVHSRYIVEMNAVLGQAKTELSLWTYSKLSAAGVQPQQASYAQGCGGMPLGPLMLPFSSQWSATSADGGGNNNQSTGRGPIPTPPAHWAPASYSTLATPANPAIPNAAAAATAFLFPSIIPSPAVPPVANGMTTAAVPFGSSSLQLFESLQRPPPASVGGGGWGGGPLSLVPLPAPGGPPPLSQSSMATSPSFGRPLPLEILNAMVQRSVGPTNSTAAPTILAQGDGRGDLPSTNLIITETHDVSDQAVELTLAPRRDAGAPGVGSTTTVPFAFVHPLCEHGVDEPSSTDHHRLTSTTSSSVPSDQNDNNGLNSHFNVDAEPSWHRGTFPFLLQNHPFIRRALAKRLRSTQHGTTTTTMRTPRDDDHIMSLIGGEGLTVSLNGAQENIIIEVVDNLLRKAYVVEDHYHATKNDDTHQEVEGGEGGESSSRIDVAHPNNRYLALVDVYGAAMHPSFVRTGLTSTEKQCARILEQYCTPLPMAAVPPFNGLSPAERQRRLSQVRAVKPSLHDFRAAFDKFTSDQLIGLNWDNVFVAGGSVLACLMPATLDPATPVAPRGAGGLAQRNRDCPEAGFKGSDIDIFLYGLTDVQAAEKVRHIYDVVMRNRAAATSAREGAAASPVGTVKRPRRGHADDGRGEGDDDDVNIVRTAHAITIIGQFPHRHIQLVLRMYRSPAEVLLGFDVDACSVGFDGFRPWCTLRARRALCKRINLFDLSRRSLTYEKRLHKYSRRGFAVLVPDLDLSKIDYPSLHGIRGQGLKGARLLLGFDEGERRAVLRAEVIKEATSTEPIVALRREIDACKRQLGRGRRRRRMKQANPELAQRWVTLTLELRRRMKGHRRGVKSEGKQQRMLNRGYNYTGRRGRPTKADWSMKFANQMSWKLWKKHGLPAAEAGQTSEMAVLRETTIAQHVDRTRSQTQGRGGAAAANAIGSPLLGTDDGCDYAMDAYLPWGPKWPNWQIHQHLRQTQHTQALAELPQTIFFGLEDALYRTEEEEERETGDHDEHADDHDEPRHGDGDEEGAGRRRGAKPPRPPVRFLRRNPGSQLLTGSFHPVSDDNYFDGLYLVVRSDDASTNAGKSVARLRVRFAAPPLAPVVPSSAPASSSSSAAPQLSLLDALAELSGGAVDAATQRLVSVVGAAAFNRQLLPAPFTLSLATVSPKSTAMARVDSESSERD